MEKSICIEVPKAAESDLYLNVFGHSVTESLHKAGPCVKSFYLIHFILEGEGTFMVNNVTYHLKKGQGFLIEPDYQVTYISDKANPWAYVWVGFSGREAGKMLRTIGLSQENPIFTCEEGEKLEKYVFDMLAHNYSNHADSYRLTGMLYLFLSAIAKAQHRGALGEHLCKSCSCLYPKPLQHSRFRRRNIGLRRNQPQLFKLSF